jgi:tetratricopeptide (TPR) repeat protein
MPVEFEGHRTETGFARWWGVVFLALVLDSAWLLVGVGPTVQYFAGVVAHLLLGLLWITLGWRLLRAPEAWRGLRGLTSACLALGAVTGLGVMVVGATRPVRGLLYVHIASSLLGALLLLGRWLRVSDGPAWRRRLAGATLLALALSGAAAVQRERTRPERERIVNPTEPPLTMAGEGGGPRSPFFPSSAETNVGGTVPADFFMTSQACGRCHTEIYAQWAASAHHFSSFNNQWYRKSIEYMQDVVGTQPSKWCAGCHDHAVFFNGRFDRPIKEQIDTPEAQAGLGCTSCHSIVHVKSTMGQGDFTIEYPPLHDLAASEQPLLVLAHDYLLKIAPVPHRQTFLKRFHQEQPAEFCSACHKVHLDVPVNAYRWFRGFNEYDNWQASGVSGEGARSFYYPAKPQTCANCHMPLVPARDPAARDGRVHSHRFPGANTALPFVNKDPEQLRVVQDFLRDGQISVDVFGLVRGAPGDVPESSAPSQEPRLSSTFAQGEESAAFGASPVALGPAREVLAPLDRLSARVRRGESVRVEVVVRTRKVGHFFPGGTVDAFDVWVEFEAVDDSGRVLLHSGAAADGGRGPVDPGAHFYRSLMLDAHGNRIDKRNAWMTRSVAYVRLIPPGAADTVHYRLDVPPEASGRIRLRARVNYRKFAWWNTQWAYAGVRDPEHKDFALGPGHDDGRWVFTGDTARVSGQIKAIPDIPTTVMAQAEAWLDVLPAGAALPEERALLEPAVRERFNDYGIGLLLQGDLKGAEAAFLAVTRMDPGYADGWVNVGRARLQEGNTAGAREVLERALQLAPELAKTHFFLGSTSKAEGRYDDALAHLRQAAARYPRDRVVQGQIGRVLFLKRAYREAIATFERVLAIDPEDLLAHYNLMLCWRGLGDDVRAQRAQALYERFKADESAQAISGPYRRLHPHDNNERQAVHEHGAGVPEAPYAAASPAPTRAARRVSATPRGAASAYDTPRGPASGTPAPRRRERRP